MLIKKLRIWIQKRQQQIAVFRSSHRRCSVKTVVNRNFAKFTGKHLWQSLYFNKLAGLACNFVKKETLAQLFSIEFCEILRTPFLFLQNTSGRLLLSIQRNEIKWRYSETNLKRTWNFLMLHDVSRRAEWNEMCVIDTM